MQAPDDEEDEAAAYQQWLQDFLPSYRDHLLRQGTSKDVVDGFVRLAWTEPAMTINSVEDYKRACGLHEVMQKGVAKDDFLSPAAVRLHALGGEMIRFEEQYEKEHGCLPDTK